MRTRPTFDLTAYSFKEDSEVLEVLRNISLPDMPTSREIEEETSDRQRLMEGLKFEDIAKLCEATVEMRYLAILLPPHRKTGQLVLLDSSEMPLAPVIISALSSPMPPPGNEPRHPLNPVGRHRAFRLSPDFPSLSLEEQKNCLLAAYGADKPVSSIPNTAEITIPHMYPDLRNSDTQLTIYAEFITRQAAAQQERLVSVGSADTPDNTPTCLCGAMSPLDQLIGIRLIGQALVCPTDWPDILK